MTAQNSAVADSALILGLAGIGGTVAVGIASPWVAARFVSEQQERTFAHERTMRDSEELRAVLDELAGCLEDCDSAMQAAFHQLLRWGRKVGEEPGRAKLEGLDTASERLRHVVGRLAIRLGEDHPVNRPATDTQLALRTFISAVENVAFLGDQADLVKLNAEAEKGRQDFDRARSAFVEAASAHAGSQLPQRAESA
jgi:hypothetical protein